MLAPSVETAAVAPRRLDDPADPPVAPGQQALDDAGLDRDWLWQDWRDAVDPAGGAEVEDCRWTPCYDCGVCPQMDTEIQIGPTGQKLLPLTPV